MHCEPGTAPGDSHGHSSAEEHGQRGRAASMSSETGEELPTPSHVSSELGHVLLRDRNSVTHTRGNPQPAPGFGWHSKVWLQRCCLLAGTWRQTFENLPFNKIDLMRSSAPFGMLITKQPGEKCLGIKGVATLVLLCFGFLVREPADTCQSLATRNQHTLARAWLPHWSHCSQEEPPGSPMLQPCKPGLLTIPFTSQLNPHLIPCL